MLQDYANAQERKDEQKTGGQKLKDPAADQEQSLEFNNSSGDQIMW
jgi:hypothetical protein